MTLKKKTHTPKSVIKFKDQWTELEKGIKQLFHFLDSDLKKPFDHEEHIKLYTIVYNLCTEKVDTGIAGVSAAELLYTNYEKCINSYLIENVVPALKNTNKETLLPKAVKRWRNHMVLVRFLQKVFSYVDIYYTKHHNKSSLRDVGLKCYSEQVYKSINKDMARSLLDKIHAERKGEVIDRLAMKDGVHLFIEMGLNSLETYIKDFESPLIEETKNFYDVESSRWINEDSCPEYLLKAEEKLREEEDRAKAYLHHATETPLIQTVEKSIITTHAHRLLNMENSGFIPLLKNLEEKKDDLKRMYVLFKRVRELHSMSEMLRDYVQKEGMNIVNLHQKSEDLDYKSFINGLLDLHEKYSSLLNEQFDKDPSFLDALKDAFTHFVNTELEDAKGKKITTAELLSTHCDFIMKNTDKIGEENLDEVLEKIVRLFAYISDKDMFQEYYRRQLSKRLLVSSNANHDAERTLIAKLKTLCGASFTSKLEGMIKDKTTSEELQNAFKEHCRIGEVLPLDFTPTILTTGFWPSFKVDQLTIPPEMDVCLKKFKEFYDSRTESRTLKWIHSLGSCTISALYAAGNKELQLSTYQACILLLFNDTADGVVNLSPEDIQKTLNLTPDDIRRNLLSLCMNKQAKILMRTTNAEETKSISPNDQFSVNPDFKSKKHRIKIPNLILKMTGEERKDIDKTTEEDRKHAIEAAIVRIMKARREMKHQNLVLECSKQLMQHFIPDPKIIKTRINDLIAREYIERDSNDPTTYLYVA